MKLTIIFLLLCQMAWGQNSGKFVINGKIPGIKDGLEVNLSLISSDSDEPLAKTVTKDGQFILTGKIDYPEMCLLYIDVSPEIKDVYSKKMLGSSLLVGNGKITYSCENVDSLPILMDATCNVKIGGLAIAEQYNAYQTALFDIVKKYHQLYEKYLEIYQQPAMEGVFNTHEGVSMVNEFRIMEKQMQDIRWEFLRRNGNSPVGLEVAKELLTKAEGTFTKQQIDEVVAALNPSLMKLPGYKTVKDIAENMYPVAIGEKFIDIELLDKDGNTVHLADYIKPGQYNMLEFWASWCGPCRGEIPHLRLVNKLYGQEFNLISISVDERDKDWKEALEKENMSWTQLNDPDPAKGPVTMKYKVDGIPFSVLLDKEGRIIAGGCSGAVLDRILIELLGDKYEK